MSVASCVEARESIDSVEHDDASVLTRLTGCWLSVRPAGSGSLPASSLLSTEFSLGNLQQPLASAVAIAMLQLQRENGLLIPVKYADTRYKLLATLQNGKVTHLRNQ